MYSKKNILNATFGALKLTTAFVFVVAMVSTFALAETAAAKKYEAGVHYDILEAPVRTRDRSKVEVVEVFWYGCSHCMNFEPIVHEWASKQKSSVDFWQSPAVWSPAMEVHAKAFYAIKALKLTDKLTKPLFTALTLERKQLNSASQMESFFVANGVDKAKFNKIFNSFAIGSMVSQADARARSYKISGTPEMVVNGKFRVDAKKAGGQKEMLEVVDFLVKQELALLTSK